MYIPIFQIFLIKEFFIDRLYRYTMFYRINITVKVLSRNRERERERERERGGGDAWMYV